MARLVVDTREGALRAALTTAQVEFEVQQLDVGDALGRAAAGKLRGRR